MFWAWTLRIGNLSADLDGILRSELSLLVSCTIPYTPAR